MAYVTKWNKRFESAKKRGLDYNESKAYANILAKLEKKRKKQSSEWDIS